MTSQTDDFFSVIALMEAWLETKMAQAQLPSITIGIIHGQELIYEGAFGYADVSKKINATSSTLYRIASITKPFTAIAIMQLREAGKLKLNDPVQKYLSWFTIKSPKNKEYKITIKQLLTHTSGLPRDAAFPYWMSGRFPSFKEVRKKLPSQEMAYRPLFRQKYSNLAYSLLGEIISSITKQSYEDYVKKNILLPLGMKSSSFFLDKSTRKKLATGYGVLFPFKKKRRVFLHHETRGLGAAAGLSSNVLDLAKFISFQLSNGKAKTTLLKPSSLREMQRLHWLRPNGREGSGLGFLIKKMEGLKLVRHSGSYIGFRSEIAFSTQHQLGIIILSNSDDKVPTPYAEQIFKWLISIRRAIPKKKLKTPSVLSNKFLGKYANRWVLSQVILYEGKLAIIYPSEIDPKGSMLKLIPCGKNLFRTQAMDLSSMEDGDIIRFEFDRGKKANGYFYNEIFYDRLIK